MRILLTGRDGQVGRELSRSLAKLGEVTATGRDELDLTSDYAIGDMVHEVRPQLIVNAAAYTAVDKAESEPDFAHRINAEAVGTLAAAAKSVGAAIIHYSTDYVFDGSKEMPYVETDRPHPLSVYGKSKLDGEKALAAAGIPYLILRTSWVYGAEGKNFLLNILRLAMERSELRVVNDQIGAPTWSRDIAKATASITEKWHQHE
ncbi:MAG: dTDP-4-dehydrorhamnose reductase, partial [Acidobacteriota bacterium]